jgi:hypothetical protein
MMLMLLLKKHGLSVHSIHPKAYIHHRRLCFVLVAIAFLTALLSSCKGSARLVGQTTTAIQKHFELGAESAAVFFVLLFIVKVYPGHASPSHEEERWRGAARAGTAGPAAPQLGRKV